MQDGRDDHSRQGATSALDDVRARSAERFGRKGSPDSEADEVIAEDPPHPTADRDEAAPIEQPTATSDEASDDVTEDSVDLVDVESAAEESESAESVDDDTEVDATIGTRPVEAEVRMSDGANYVGVIHIREDERVLDYLNSPSPFFALTESSGKVRLLSKGQVLQIMPYDKGDVNASARRGGGALM